MAVKYSIIKRNTLFIISIIVILVMVGIFGVGKLKEVTETSSDYDEVMFDNMFSSARYFFRVGYPDGWTYETGNYGFYLDEARHQVVELYPRKLVKEPEEGAEPQPTDYERIDGVAVKIFYVPMDNADLSYTAADAMNDLREAIGEPDGYTFGTVSDLITEDIQMKKIDYSYYVEGVTHKCSIYTATRSVGKYVIVTDCKGYVLNDYQGTFAKMIEDFRFSVFED